MGKSCSSNLIAAAEFPAAVFWPSSFLLMRDTNASSSSIKPQRKESGRFWEGDREMDVPCRGRPKG